MTLSSTLRHRRLWLAALASGGALVAAAFVPGAQAVPTVTGIPTITFVITIPPFLTIPPLILLPVKDISVAVTDDKATIDQGASVVTKITVTNNWSSPVSGINVLYSPPANHTGTIWACTVAPADSCGGSTTGSGPISRSISLSAYTSAVFTVSSAVSATATGTITSSVTIVPPVSLGDVTASNNSAADTTTVNLPATSTTTALTTTTSTTIAVVPPSTTVPPTAAPTVAPTAAPTAAPTIAPPAGSDGFQSPTGGIQCLYFVDNGVQRLRCLVKDSTAKLPKRPANCDFDWEDIGLAETGRAYTVCAGDTVAGNYPSVAYGATWKRGVFTCTSAKSGVTCRNPSRRGFRVSKTKRTYL